jgi:hypothetical protein
MAPYTFLGGAVISEEHAASIISVEVRANRNGEEEVTL